MKQTGVQSANSVPPPRNQLLPNTRRTPKLPLRVLLTGPREHYVRLGVPLYEASMKGDWKAAKTIFDEYPDRELVRCSITENGETALHVAASAKGSKYMKEFVKNLVDLMTEKDLELENENFNTAMYLAAVAGNIETVKIMVKKNRTLLTIPGGAGRQMMPLYAAALFGHYEVVKFLYQNSVGLRDDDGWTPINRGWLIEKCVEGDMFDVALEIVKKYPELGRKRVLAILARKPEAFRGRKSNIIKRTMKSVFAFIGLNVGASEKENKALALLKLIWEEIANKPKSEIDNILRGLPDSIKEDKKSASGWAVLAMEFQKLISDHVDKMEVETLNIIRGQPDSMSNQDTKPTSREVNLASQLQNLISECLMKIRAEAPRIMISGCPDLIRQENKPVSTKEIQALELQNLIFEHISEMHEETQMILNNSRKETQAQELQKVIFKHIQNIRKEAQKPAKETYSSRVLFIAAELGNTNYLVELIRRYPDLIWKVNDSNQTIFHVAVEHRHEGIYNLLYEIGAMKDLVTPLRDANDNTMLHLAAKSTKKIRLENVSGAALKIQRELLWFKEVRNMVPPYYRERKNKDGLTPRELFTKEHTDLIRHAEKWMKETASQCMVVAALIATIVFAAAFTVPGGYNQNDGIPIFYRKLPFIVFVVADAISLFLSSTSILTFLSILTSRYAERDFVESLPTKLMLGLVTLFLSITTMMITFSVSFFILYHKEMKWIPIFIAIFAVLPALVYVVLQYHLLVDVIRSTYGSKYLFKPQKGVLFYKNPKV